MLTYTQKKNLSLLLILALVLPLVALHVSAATTVYVLDNKISVKGEFGTNLLQQDAGSISVENNVVTATAAAGGAQAQYTTTITIKNESSTTAKITFDYSLSNGTSFSESSTSGTKTVDLDVGSSITMSFKNKKSWTQTTATLTLSNFTYTAAADESEVTFEYENGTVTVAGAEIASGDKVNIDSTNGAALVATPNSGYKFLGWVNGNNNLLLSTDSSYTLKPTENMKVKAAFASASSKAWFKVGDYMVDDLNVAVTLGPLVIPVYDGTLPAGDYTIPAGVTLLIPYNDAYTLCTTKPTSHDDTYTTPSAYRTLTMANGANIKVNGAISVSGSQSSQYLYNGMPSGPLGFIHMNSGSTISVESGGALYAWGYIKGSGSVEIKSGGTVYECFQVADYRGGDATSTMTSNSNSETYGVFPFNQYYVQNVEVPMTLHAGSIEKGFIAVSVTLAGTQTSEVPFFGTSDSMFVISSGYVVKDYLEGTGRTEIKICGDVSASSVSISLKVALVGDITIDSSKYALPIPHHFTVKAESGSITLDQSLAFLPGSEFYIGEAASCTLGSGKKIYVYDLDEWLYNNGANGYSGTTNQPYINIPYVPGGNGTTGRLKDALVQVDGTVDATAGSVYVTAGGANIYSTGTGVVKVAATTDATVYQVITNGTDIDSWPEIAMQPAILQDGDGTDVKTTAAENGGGHGAGTYTYYANTQKWCPPGHRYGEGVVTNPTCTEAGYTTKTCVACGNTTTETGDTATGHTWDWAQGVCTVCDEKAIQCNGIKLDVRSEIQLLLKFTVHEDTLKQYPNLAAFVSEEANEIAANGAWDPIAVSTLDKDENGKYVISCGIAAGEMTGLVSVEFKTDSSDTAAVVPVYDKYQQKMVGKVEKNVVSFAEAALAVEGESSDDVALCNGALTFGGYAQLFYGTHTDKLAYEFLNAGKAENFAPSLAGADDALEKVAATEFSGSNGVKASTQKLNLDSEIYIRTYFKLATDKTEEDYTVTVSGPARNDEGTFTDTVALVYDEASKRWYVDILNVPPAFWNDTYTITVTDNSMTENNIYTVETSVLAWCARCVNAQNASEAQKNMARAMYFYNLAADTYFDTE